MLDSTELIRKELDSLLSGWAADYINGGASRDAWGVVTATENEYAWENHKDTWHVRDCGLSKTDTSTAHEEQRSFFEDTMSENDERYYIDCTNMRCHCGLLYGFTVRIAATVGEVIYGVNNRI